MQRATEVRAQLRQSLAALILIARERTRRQCAKQQKQTTATATAVAATTAAGGGVVVAGGLCGRASGRSRIIDEDEVGDADPFTVRSNVRAVTDYS